MRDLIILGLLVVTVLWALKAPWIGIMGWTLVSLMSPHAEFGYAAAAWPVATGYAAATILGLLFTQERQNPLVGAGPKWLLAFTVWICITLPFSLLYEASFGLWERSMKIYLMVFVTLALLDTKKKLTVFIWINVIAIGYFGVKGGVFTIATGGSYRVWGPGGFIQGNNEIALAVLSVTPLLRFLQMQQTKRWAIHAFTGAMLLCVATALGTQSRGALVGLVCMGTFFWVKGNRKLLSGAVILAIALLALPMMPDTWWDRMETIKTYEQDDSALGRINAWGMAWNLAKDRIFGGGFMIWTGSIFAIYGPEPDRVHAAHSIYFQVMGEHGFIGLGLWMAIGAATWFAARDLIKLGRAHPEHKWAADLGPMIQVSMISYASAGAFLSLSYYDLPYNVMIMATVAQRLVRAAVRDAARAPARPQMAVPPAAPREQGGPAGQPPPPPRRHV
ncbi:putative O-glycosylation ligase, exosortase A system-associated [Rubrivivax rivuli]|uniref:putative O-glycosylation ligase, exosortase A system-associated n=1 Tax=Rubrivivax rivuli TaxID=1862385 RepID=UPI0013E30F7D|nr:putative O-glycosylation ligase, exosortase A system-associated [Rubrivivax rivuli]